MIVSLFSSSVSFVSSVSTQPNRPTNAISDMSRDHHVASSSVVLVSSAENAI